MPSASTVAAKVDYVADQGKVTSAGGSALGRYTCERCRDRGHPIGGIELSWATAPGYPNGAKAAPRRLAEVPGRNHTATPVARCPGVGTISLDDRAFKKLHPVGEDLRQDRTRRGECVWIKPRVVVAFASAGTRRTATPARSAPRSTGATSFMLGPAIAAERRIMGVMDVELLVVQECPNEASAARLLRTALDDIGLPDTEFDTTVVGGQRDAERRGFTGSPAFCVDGCDLFREPGRPASLSCRLYRSADRVGGVPDLVELRLALKRAAVRH